MTPPSETARLVAAVLDSPPRLGPVRLVAVDGPSGSGKSTYAAGLLAAFVAAPGVGRGVTRVSQDAIAPGTGRGVTRVSPHVIAPGASCVSPDVIAPGKSSPSGAVLVGTDDFATWDDPVAWWARLVDGVLQPFACGRPARYRRTEWSGGEPHPGAWVTIATPLVLILDGVSAGRRSIYDALSALVWLEVPAPDRLARAVARDGESSRESLTTWQNFESGWFAVDGTARRATHRPPTGHSVSA